MSLVGVLSREKHTYYTGVYKSIQHIGNKNESIFEISSCSGTNEVNDVDGKDSYPVYKDEEILKKNLRASFSELVTAFTADTIGKIRNGYDEPSIQTGAVSYTKKEWERLLRRVDATQKKLEENTEYTTGVQEKKTNPVVKSTEEKEELSLLEEMLEEVPKEEKGDSLEIYEQEPDMLLLTYTQAVYPSNDKSKEDTVYFTFYDEDGIYCKKSRESGFEWKISLKDSSQYEKVMEYLKKYEGRDNLWFASRKDFWRDFLEDGIDLEKFDSFMDNRVVDGIPQFVDYFEDRADISMEALEFYKYMGGESFGHLLTEEEINEMLYPKNGGKFVIDDISNINLESLYALHPDEIGKKVNYYNGRWYTDYEMAVIARKELVKLLEENQFSTVELA